MKVLTSEKIPIKMWLTEIEEGALEQAKNIANLPFVFKWVSLMSDAHVGYSCPIGSVVATKGVVIIGCVGVDIGCGVAFLPTNIPVDLLYKDTGTNGMLLKAIVGNIKRNVPVGFEHHKEKQECISLDIAREKYEQLDGELLKEIERGYYQVGTLGSGNHCIDLCKDDENNLGILLHSGSRNFGKKICDYYAKVSKRLNEYWFSSVDSSTGLNFLPTDSKEGQEYMDWMNLALDFAQENRQLMINRSLSVILNMVKKYDGFEGIEIGEQINIHHNYAAMENHYGENVMIHRKGATKATEKTIGVILGSMGTNSYVVRGLDNPESFKSCSHGAGRRMGRKEAIRSLDLEQEKKKMAGIVNDLTCSAKLDEAPGAYKDIEEVMRNQKDLVQIVKTLKTIANIKG